MSISFECPSCGKKLKAPDNAAGKSSKCPQCGAKVTCPEPIYEAEVAEEVYGDATPAGFNPFDDLDDGTPYNLKDPDPYAPPADAPEGPRRPCPMCGELILASAAKCRFCGEIFDPKLKKKSRSKKYGAAAEDMSGGDWVVALLCPGIGCIAGIIWMIQGKPKGAKMFGVSFAVNAFWTVVQVILRTQLNPQGGP